MKTLTLTAALTFVLHSLACGGQQRPGSAPAPSPTPETVIVNESGLSPGGTAVLKDLLFADLTLEKLLAATDPNSPGAKEDPWRGFASAVEHTKRGKPEEAKKDLRRVLAMPEPETRIVLSAWTALRAMGERPPRDAADEVQGVVCELHNEAGIGTLAAYADGRARWLAGQGAGSIWEAPGSDKEVDDLIAALLKSVGPLVKRAPAVETRAPAEVEMEHFRVSVLTLGGIHVVDVYGPDIDGKERHLAPTLMASVRLLDALTERVNRKGK
ncbi:MAG TPA: hypothetical protein VM914_13875 [Pyrinomonadaceae bacterium]|jgi:hypothetical protein|nr:hypothetical protein [Pyrinomonadaceae bacterium]